MNELTKLIKTINVKSESDCFMVNGQMMRAIMAVGYPRTMHENWLSQAVISEGDFDLSMYIKPVPAQSIVPQFNQELSQALGGEKVFSVSLYFGAKAYDKERLNRLTEKILAEINLMKIIPKLPFLRMLDGAKSLYPIQEDKLNISHYVSGDALASGFPFITDKKEPIQQEVAVDPEIAKAHMIVEKLKELSVVKENLEPYKMEENYYLVKELNAQQIAFLKKNDYVKARLCGLNSFSQVYLIRAPTGNESIEHYFLCEVIAKEIRHHAKNVKTDATVDADITFEIEKNGVKELFAFEIETGLQSRQKFDLNEKTTKNNSKFKQWWFIVTNKYLKPEYEKYHQTLTRTEIKPLLFELFKE
jgi:hypothetical protein